jgi:putative protease
MAKKLIGKIAHYFNKIGVAVVDLQGVLSIGDEIIIERKGGEEFTQKVKSMQIEHEKVEKAGKGQSVGLKTEQIVREGDLVYKE